MVQNEQRTGGGTGQSFPKRVEKCCKVSMSGAEYSLRQRTFLVLFHGFSEHNIDPKLRLAIPAKYRNQWIDERDGKAWVCVPWPTGQLRLFTERRFEEMAEAAGKSLTPTRAEMEIEQLMFGNSERLEMDSAGRITLTKRLIEQVGLKTQVAIVGARMRLEVWDRAAWLAKSDEGFRQLQEKVEASEEQRPPGM